LSAADGELLLKTHSRRVGGRIAFAIVTAVVLAYAWWPPAPGPNETPDRVLVMKGARKLILLKDGQTLREYSVALSPDPIGGKTRAGDHKTPEGPYVVDFKNPHSNFHLALHVSYPNAEDRARAAAAGTDPGGDIEVHGIKNGLGWVGRFQRWMGWTNGCIAVTNAEIEQIYKAVPAGTPIEIRP
jgi:murein L,D-transpeptidase YafK